MADQKIRIPRASDRSICNALAELVEKYQERFRVVQAGGHALGGVPLPSVDFSPESLQDGVWSALLRQDSYLIESLSVNFSGLDIRYYRGGAPNQSDSNSPIYDDLVIRGDKAEPSPPDRFEIISHLLKSLRGLEVDRIDSTLDPRATAQVISIHENVLNRLERLAESLIRDTNDYRKQLDEDHDAKAKQLDQRASERQEALDAQHEKRLEQLREEEEALNAKQATIDDRDNTHARREIRNRMLDDVKQRVETFGVSKNTASKRRPVFWGMVALGTVFTALLIWAVIEVRTGDELQRSALNLAKVVEPISKSL